MHLYGVNYSKAMYGAPAYSLAQYHVRGFVQRGQQRSEPSRIQFPLKKTFSKTYVVRLQDQFATHIWSREICGLTCSSCRLLPELHCSTEAQSGVLARQNSCWPMRKTNKNQIPLKDNKMTTESELIITLLYHFISSNTKPKLTLFTC